MDIDASFRFYLCEFYSNELPYNIILTHSQELHSGYNMSCMVGMMYGGVMYGGGDVWWG